MALHRGIQSAIFYYLSCAPCTGYSYRKKRRKEAIRDRALKHALQEDNPGLYRHPSPFATNPHWQEEIELGPTHIRTRKKDKSGKELKRTQTVGTYNGSQEGSSTDLGSRPSSEKVKNDGQWNLRRYQREDEELWGSSSVNLPRSVSKTSNLAGSVDGDNMLTRPPTARTAQTRRSSNSYYSTNPPVSDLHPATVTRYNSREDAMWMMQPPPPPAVMSGKERASNRSRSDSGASRLSSRRGGDEKLSRQLSNRIMEEKLLKSRDTLATSTLDVSRRNSQRSTGSGPRSQRHDWATDPSANPSTEETAANANANANPDDKDTQPKRERKRRPPPLAISEDSTHSATTVHHNHNHNHNHNHPYTTAARPHLSTINSSGQPASGTPSGATTPTPSRRNTISAAHSRDSSLDRGRLGRERRPPTTTVPPDSSLKVLQELVPASSLLNINTATNTDAANGNSLRKDLRTKTPSFEARVSLPPANGVGDGGEGDELDMDMDMDDGWHSGVDGRDFSLPQWAADSVARDVRTIRHRWSMHF